MLQGHHHNGDQADRRPHIGAGSVNRMNNEPKKKEDILKRTRYLDMKRKSKRETPRRNDIPAGNEEDIRGETTV